MRTAFKIVTGLGPAHDGVGHFVRQRVTALVLLVLVPLFLFQFLASLNTGYGGVVAWLGSPFGALLTLVLVSAMIAHMRIGLRVVIEDYVSGGARRLLLLLNALTTLALWLAAVYALVKINFGG